MKSIYFGKVCQFARTDEKVTPYFVTNPRTLWPAEKAKKVPPFDVAPCATPLKRKKGKSEDKEKKSPVPGKI